MRMSDRKARRNVTNPFISWDACWPQFYLFIIITVIIIIYIAITIIICVMFVLRASSNSNLFAIGLNAVALCWTVCSNAFAMDVTFMRSLGKMQHNLRVICEIFFWLRHKHIRSERKNWELKYPNPMMMMITTTAVVLLVGMFSFPLASIHWVRQSIFKTSLHSFDKSLSLKHTDIHNINNLSFNIVVGYVRL